MKWARIPGPVRRGFVRVRRGFTLLESLVALVVIGLAATVAMEALAGALRGERQASRHLEAVALAVAGLVVLAAYGVVGFASDATARVRDDRRDALAGLHARAALHGWLRDAALVDGAGPFVARHLGTTERPLDELTFRVT